MKETEALKAKIRQFRDDRDWAQFHNAKDLALALSIEAAELLELFLWKDAASADPKKLREELADILMYALLLADHEGLDITEIIEEKIRQNNEKYPVEKARGSSKKYNEL